MALHFNSCPTELEEDQVLDYLHYLKSKSRTPSSSYFKHTVYGLRLAYKLSGVPSKQIFLPKLKLPKKLPVVLSQSEVKRLIKAAPLLKHQLIIGLLYGCGLRRFELINLQIRDVDVDRQMLYIREGKGRKDRYVPLGCLLVRGLQKYLQVEKPYLWLFNGRGPDGNLQQYSPTGVQWAIREAAKKAGIQKRVTSHVLRHTYATHLLEMGLDIMTLKDLLGHVDIKTTLVYLHVAQLDKERAFSPLDRLYHKSRS
ncbi:tyrosine-type recombinase/integrase [Carboxylicivirga caseinilyticus]|uniref:tyrosine-type recombinase/integrase n=1 Tax=Carboxylicivirga caseinilyticus TaxID=3417572 RepID=UPI003D3533FB|nr:tyrosine-type recombinase/integrase [Marinilabiliaceae bacterium A049]